MGISCKDLNVNKPLPCKNCLMVGSCTCKCLTGEGRLINKLWLHQLLTRLVAQRSTDFVGIGVIAYRTIENLPVVPLGSRLNADKGLPISGTDDVFKVLAMLATRGSSMHDGFTSLRQKVEISLILRNLYLLLSMLLLPTH
jgi:hypothetical protein